MFAVKLLFASAAEVVLRNDMAAFQLSLHKARNLIGLTAQHTMPPMYGRQPYRGSITVAQQSSKTARQLTAARGIHGRVEANLIAQKAARSARRTQTRMEPGA